MKMKKLKNYVVEYYEIDHYFHREEVCYSWRTAQYYYSNKNWLIPSCFKKTYFKRFNSKSKLNKELGFIKGKSYCVYNNLEFAIKTLNDGHFGGWGSLPNGVLIIKCLHNLDGYYFND